MLEAGQCTIAYTPNYKLPKQQIAGGHHTKSVKGFFVNTKVYELDVKGQYPSIVINNNFSFDTLNCTCCEYREDAQVKQEIIDTINEQLEENEINRRVEKYWVCRRFKGAFPQVVDKVLGLRDRYLGLLKQERRKPNPDSKLIEEYQTHQLGAKLFVNAGAGLFGTKYFEFSNYIVNECITAEGRRIHKQMEAMGQREPYNFKIVFGFTDSTFFVNVPSEEKAREFIQDCKDRLGVTVELKNIFVNSVFYDKKNRFVAWTGNENEPPIIKGINGLSESDPLWIKRWAEKILVQLIKPCPLYLFF
jgi:DNA polymerase elongation subunit (family B)